MVGSEGICAAMKQLYKEMDTTSEPVTPLVMLKVLHMTFPRFAERGEGGVFQQQVLISAEIFLFLNWSVVLYL